MTLWKPQYTIDDLKKLDEILQAWLSLRSEVDWSTRTGMREQDWTLKEVLCHLVSISQFFFMAAQSARHGEPLQMSKRYQREDLRDLNDSELQRLAGHSPAELLSILHQSLVDVMTLAAQLTPDDYDKMADVMIYDRPVTLVDLIDSQLSHAGLIHGAQITRITPDTPPIWREFPDDMAIRTIDRFLRHLSCVYWSERAGGLQGVIHFQVGGNHRWAYQLSSQGAYAQRGWTETAPLMTLVFAQVETFYQFFTGGLAVPQAFQEGRLRVTGTYPEPFKLIGYFSPSPPKYDLPAYSDGTA